ncbi:hypothetical protein HK098_003715 [Nowakowskiella sp. JEL0407]|nr:hypothetical protein HK098_003715 [Nowakowskiella sp. JEL0407]
MQLRLSVIYSISIELLMINLVFAHSGLFYPMPRGSPANDKATFKDTDCFTAPLNGGAGCDPKPFPCKGYKEAEVPDGNKFRAGQVIDVQFWNYDFVSNTGVVDQTKVNDDQARHSGGIAEFSLSIDGGLTWHVICRYTKGAPDVNCADVELEGAGNKLLSGPDILRGNLRSANFDKTICPARDVDPPSNTKGPGPTDREKELNRNGQLPGLAFDTSDPTCIKVSGLPDPQVVAAPPASPTSSTTSSSTTSSTETSPTTTSSTSSPTKTSPTTSPSTSSPKTSPTVSPLESPRTSPSTPTTGPSFSPQTVISSASPTEIETPTETKTPDYTDCEEESPTESMTPECNEEEEESPTPGSDYLEGDLYYSAMGWRQENRRAEMMKLYRRVKGGRHDEN